MLQKHTSQIYSEITLSPLGTDFSLIFNVAFLKCFMANSNKGFILPSSAESIRNHSYQNNFTLGQRIVWFYRLNFNPLNESVWKEIQESKELYPIN